MCLNRPRMRGARICPLHCSGKILSSTSCSNFFPHMEGGVTARGAVPSPRPTPYSAVIAWFPSSRSCVVAAPAFLPDGGPVTDGAPVPRPPDGSSHSPMRSFSVPCSAKLFSVNAPLGSLEGFCQVASVSRKSVSIPVQCPRSKFCGFF